MTPGLQWFIRFYGRPRPARNELDDRLRTEAAARSSGHRNGLASLEVRTAPEAAFRKNFRLLRSFETAMSSLKSDDRGPEGGVVLHFVRSRGAEALERGKQHAFWRNTEANPAHEVLNPAGYRFSGFYQRKRREAYAAARMLVQFPLALSWLRGVDLCTDEVGIPTWVIEPVLRYMHEAGEIASRIAKRELGLEIPPLLRSLHAGEDFVHLLSGLRRLHEPIRFLGMRDGDRFGHAFALAVDPFRWAARAGRVAVWREDRLFDLLWVWSWYAVGQDLPAERRGAIEDEIAEHAEQIFNRTDRTRDELSPRRLWELYERLHDENALLHLGYPTGPYPSDVKEYALELDWLTSGEVFRRSRDVVWLSTEAEAELIAAAQTALAHEVASAGITIEVNPSSNLLIGQLSDLEDHPLWRLQSLQDGEDLPPVDVCIGSDDPLTFATDLRHEYQLLHDAAVAGGKSVHEANSIVDKLKDAGMAARFTLPRPPLSITDCPALDANPAIDPMP